MLRIEESMARLKEELNEQNRIYEERKAERAALRRRAFSNVKELSAPVTSQFTSPTVVQQMNSSRIDAELSSRHSQSPPANRTSFTRQGETTSIHEPDNGMSAVRELTQSLIVAMKSTKRTSPAPAIYNGNPIDFQDWEQDFDAYVESEGLCGKEPLRYLKKFVTGKAKDAISGHFITNTEAAYRAARRDLKERFGSKHKVYRALRKRLDEFPKVGVKDAKGLRDYADFLSHLKSAMSDVPELHSLNLCQENEKLAAKLPDWMIRNWARKVKERRQTDYRYPTFEEFVYFVVDQAEVMDEPLIRNLDSNKDNPRKPKTAPSSNTKTFATISSPTQENTHKRELYKYCKKVHPTVECFSLAKLSDEDKEAFIKGNRLCYGCLNTGHLSKQCPQKARCKRCSKRHPTALHKDQSEWKTRTPINSATNREEEDGTRTPEKEEKPDETRKLDTKATIAEKSMLSMVVPVHVSTTQDPSEETLIYAMLDTQSDSSYITKETAEIVKPSYTTEKVTIDTLTGETTNWIKLYNGLQIRGYQQSESTTLEAYEWSKLTCNTRQIPNSTNVQPFAHLKEHAHKLPPPLDIPVGMLIGADCAEAFEPLECISGQKGQPFAQRTFL